MRNEVAGVGGAERASIQDIGEFLESGWRVAIPPAHCLSRPLRGLVAVAFAARVGRSEAHGQVRSRNTNAMIAARVHHHVKRSRHVAFDAARSGRASLVKVMAGRTVFARSMALEAELVAGRPQPQTVRLVTIAARHARVKHPALDKGAVF